MSFLSRMISLNEVSTIIELMITNRLSEVYMERECPDGQKILKVTLVPYRGFTYQKDDKEFTSLYFDECLDISIIYLELQRQVREFKQEEERQFEIYGVDFAAVGSKDMTIYQEIKEIDPTQKPTGKLLSEEDINKASEAILAAYPIQPPKIFVKK